MGRAVFVIVIIRRYQYPDRILHAFQKIIRLARQMLGAAPAVPLTLKYCSSINSRSNGYSCDMLLTSTCGLNQDQYVHVKLVPCAGYRTFMIIFTGYNSTRTPAHHLMSREMRFQTMWHFDMN